MNSNQDRLEQVIERGAGQGLLDELQRAVHAAVSRREGGVGDHARELSRLGEATELESADALIRALSVALDLANVAEELHRIRVLRARERDHHPEPLDESIAAAVAEMRRAGVGDRAMSSTGSHECR